MERERPPLGEGECSDAEEEEARKASRQTDENDAHMAIEDEDKDRSATAGEAKMDVDDGADKKDEAAAKEDKAPAQAEKKAQAPSTPGYEDDAVEY